MKKYRIFTLIFLMLLPLLIGIVSASLSSEGMKAYRTMEKPPLSPPAWVFSVVWTILYLMMGLASYYIIISEADVRSKMIALLLYAIQLVMNFFWSITFFNWNLYLAAFVWLIVMWCIVIACTIRFFSINKLASYLMIPYIVWLSFAAYLNLGTCVLSMTKES